MLTNPIKSLRNINFDCLHQRQGHHDITADIDLVHVDPVLNVCIMVDFKFAPEYSGMSAGQRKLYEFMVNQMRAPSVAIIALHTDDVFEKKDIDAATAVVHEIFDPALGGKWMRPRNQILLPDFCDDFKDRVQRTRAADMLRRIRH